MTDGVDVKEVERRRAEHGRYHAQQAAPGQRHDEHGQQVHDRQRDDRRDVLERVHDQRAHRDRQHRRDDACAARRRIGVEQEAHRRGHSHVSVMPPRAAAADTVGRGVIRPCRRVALKRAPRESEPKRIAVNPRTRTRCMACGESGCHPSPAARSRAWRPRASPLCASLPPLTPYASRRSWRPCSRSPYGLGERRDERAEARPSTPSARSALRRRRGMPVASGCASWRASHSPSPARARWTERRRLGIPGGSAGEEGEGGASAAPGGEALTDRRRPRRRPNTPNRTEKRSRRRTCSAPTASPKQRRRAAQTIAIVDAFDDTTVAADLQVFDNQFGLPACAEANGCFRKVNQSGKASPLPASSGELERGWAQEIATDVEVAHGVCQSCRILLVEAESNANADLYAAEQTAAALGATEISNSWGGGEPRTDNAAFNHPGVVITASSGDYGYLNWFSETGARIGRLSGQLAARGRSRRHAAEPQRDEQSVGRRDGLERRRRQRRDVQGRRRGRRRLQRAVRRPAWQQSVPDWSSVGCARQASGRGRRPPTPTRTPASRCSTRPKPKATGAGRRSAARASPRRSSPRCSRSPAARTESPTPRARCTKTSCSRRASLHDVTSGPTANAASRSKKAPARRAARSPNRRAAARPRDLPRRPRLRRPQRRWHAERHRRLPAARLEGASEAKRRSTRGGAARRAAKHGRRAARAHRARAPAASARAERPHQAGALRAEPHAQRRSPRSRAGAPRLSKLGFAFTLSAPARVRVTICQAHARAMGARGGGSSPRR